MFIKYINKLKISHLLLLSTLTFALPISMLLFFIIQEINNQIYFTQKEIWGNQLLQPLNKLIVLIPKSLVLTRLKPEKNKKEWQTLISQIDQVFSQLEVEIAQRDKILQIDAQSLTALNKENTLPSALLTQWKVLRNNTHRLNATQTLQQYNELMQHIRMLIDHIGNTSNLILDPELDSYYMMDLILLTIPQAQNRIGDILLFGKQVLSQGTLTDEDQRHFSLFASMFKEEDWQVILQHTEVSLREDKNFHGISASLQKNIPTVLNHYSQLSQEFIKMLEQLSAPNNQIPITFQTFLERGHQVVQAGSQLERVASQELTLLLQQRIKTYQSKRLSIIFWTLIASIIASFLVLSTSRNITRRLNRAIRNTGEIAAGNLTTRVIVSSQDEIGQLMKAIQKMTKNLNSLVSQIQRSGLQVTSSATELAATIKQQKTNMLNQVESTHQVGKSVEDISRIAADLVETMQQVAAMLGETSEFANQGQTNLLRMQEAMRSMENASKIISGRLEAINEKTENITSVVTTITKVADQTNLLSLNAAIEAEKAGEYGRGFNVVAREIRRLADQTAIATLEIDQMVKEMQSAVSAGVMEMDKFIAEVQQSADDVDQTSTQLKRIIEQVQSLSPSFEEVNVAMGHQCENARQINEAMGEVNEGTQQTADSLEESFLAIEQLNEAARSLQDEVSRFKVH